MQLGYMPKKRAFSLIEIIVVIAILSLLLAVLLPVLAQAREKGRQTACLSNVRQIGQALMLYQGDYENLLPIACETKDKGVYLWSSSSTKVHQSLLKAPTITVALSTYIKDGAVWQCPSDTGDRESLFRAADENTNIHIVSTNRFNLLGSSYIYRTEAGFAGSSVEKDAVGIDQLPIPLSSIILLADATCWHAKSSKVSADGIEVGLRNSFYADGHVAATQEDGFSDLWLGNLGVD